MSAIIYMRFTTEGDCTPFYMVGASREAMEQDASLFVRRGSGRIQSEIVNSEVIVAEAESRPPSATRRPGLDVLKDGVAAARAGRGSYYLFG